MADVKGYSAHRRPSSFASGRAGTRMLWPTYCLAISLRTFRAIFPYMPPLFRPTLPDDDASERAAARRMDNHTITFLKAIHFFPHSAARYL